MPKIKKQTEVKIADEIGQPKYRYFCDACTGVAFTSIEKKNPGISNCQSCGKPITEDKTENYILL